MYYILCNRAIIGVVMPLALLLAAGAYVPTSPKRGVPVITSHAIRRMPDPRSEQATGSVVSTAVGTGPKVGTRRGVEDLDTMQEISDAVDASRQTRRLVVIKWYSPGCAQCIASAPKYKRLAVQHCEAHDFYQACRLPSPTAAT